MRRGKLIIFEGGEGCGKGTQLKLLSEWLTYKNIKHVCTKEPGKNPIGQQIRQILLNKANTDLTPIAELLLYSADRTLQYNKIKNLLEQGIWVLSDRSWPSTLAYQGTAGKVSQDIIESLIQISINKIQPDLLLIINVNPELGLQKETNPDRFTDKGIEYHKEVQQGYLNIAKDYANFTRVISYVKDNIDNMQEKIRDYVKPLL